ncbi:hypothetical protein QQP08_003905 [Theobroma cacao]|nr:hypothetical protein QQP08_003905 [Theobroma cacao]
MIFSILFFPFHGSKHLQLACLNYVQYPTFCEGDLQTVVQMGYGQNPSQEMAIQSENLQGSNQVSHMKVEL